VRPAGVVFESRAAVYGVRYLASVDSRAARYDGLSGHDVAAWLNVGVHPGERVALAGYSGYPYFLRPEILLASESKDELQWLGNRAEAVAVVSPGPRVVAVDDWTKTNRAIVVVDSGRVAVLCRSWVHRCRGRRGAARDGAGELAVADGGTHPGRLRRAEDACSGSPRMERRPVWCRKGVEWRPRHDESAQRWSLGCPHTVRRAQAGSRNAGFLQHDHRR